jgi:hypothetical protein
MSRLFQQTRSDPQVRFGHVPAVLQGVLEGHWFQEVGLNLPPLPWLEKQKIKIVCSKKPV